MRIDIKRETRLITVIRHHSRCANGFDFGNR